MSKYYIITNNYNIHHVQMIVTEKNHVSLSQNVIIFTTLMCNILFFIIFHTHSRNIHHIDHNIHHNRSRHSLQSIDNNILMICKTLPLQKIAWWVIFGMGCHSYPVHSFDIMTKNLITKHQAHTHFL